MTGKDAREKGGRKPVPFLKQKPPALPSVVREGELESGLQGSAATSATDLQDD